jgi:hypothetical protein
LGLFESHEPRIIRLVNYGVSQQLLYEHYEVMKRLAGLAVAVWV